jgi:hypothetical protein
MAINSICLGCPSQIESGRLSAIAALLLWELPSLDKMHLYGDIMLCRQT